MSVPDAIFRSKIASGKVVHTSSTGPAHDDAVCAAMEDHRRKQLQLESSCFHQGNTQQKRLNDVELQVMSKMSRSHGMNNIRDKIRNRMAYQGIIHRDTNTSFMDTLEMNNRRVIADQQRLTQKMLELSQTHKEIMTMASRDCQSRGSNPMQQLPQQQLQGPTMLPSRAGYLPPHAMVRPKEKAEKGAAAQTVPLLRGEDYVFGSPPLKKRNCRASAA